MGRFLLKVLLIAAVFTIIIGVIPGSFTSSIDSSIIYFLSTLWNLNPIVDVSQLFIALQIFLNFNIGIAVVLIFHGLMSKFSSE